MNAVKLTICYLVAFVAMDWSQAFNTWILHEIHIANKTLTKFNNGHIKGFTEVVNKA